MNKISLLAPITFLILVFGCCNGLQAQAPAQSKDVMLQGFYWDSNATTSWNQLYQISGELSGNFDLIWLPPSAFSSGGTGYMPKQWSNQNGSWGSVNALKRLINALQANNCRAIADIVVNHRDGKSGWMDFYTDDFGQYGSFTFGREHVCSNDEAQYSSSVPANQKPTGAADTGDNFDGARDLDHTNVYVQNAVKAYLQWMKSMMGYDGWRYDMVKGFSASYINGYNAAGNAYMSVGEYWDGDYNAVMNWINGTGKTSTAFDFPMKYAALNQGLASNNYANMTWKDGAVSRPAGLIHSPASRRYAVTFVDNHDTYRDGSKYTGDVLKANAFILSSAGIPCVFYPHWRDHKTAINAMIKARKSVGLHSESDVEVQNTSGYYKAYSTGTCGEMITYIGSSESAWASNAPSGDGWTKACSGTGWAMYTKVTNNSCANEFQTKLDNGINPGALGDIGTITIKAKLPPSWTAPKIWVWDAGNAAKNYTGGKWPGLAMTASQDNIFSITLQNIDASEVGVVINNGGTNPTEQTVDLFALADICWELGANPVITSNPKKYEATESEDCFGTGLISANYNAISLYPNPIVNEVYLHAETPLDRLWIYSLTGELLLEESIQSQAIDLSDFSAGIYILQMTDLTGNYYSQKVIKE